MQTSDLCWRSRQPTPGDLHSPTVQGVSALKALHDIQHGHCSIFLLVQRLGPMAFLGGSSSSVPSLAPGCEAATPARMAGTLTPCHTAACPRSRSHVPGCRAAAVAELRREAAGSRDLLVIRGREEYQNLPNKSVRLLRYALSSPSG